MKVVTILASPGSCEDQNVRSCLVSEGVDRTVHILGIMVFPIREGYLSGWALFIIIPGSLWTMGSDNPLSLPGAILYPNHWQLWP